MLELVSRPVRRITTMWPGFTFRYRRRTRTFDLNGYQAVHAPICPPPLRSTRPQHYFVRVGVSGVCHVDAIDVAVEAEGALS